MNPNILIVRDENVYRILHGHLHLASQLSQHNEIEIEVKDEGTIRVIRTDHGYVAGRDGQRFPIY